MENMLSSREADSTVGTEQGPWSQAAQIPVLALPLTSSAAVGKPLPSHAPTSFPGNRGDSTADPRAALQAGDIARLRAPPFRSESCVSPGHGVVAGFYCCAEHW